MSACASPGREMTAPTPRKSASAPTRPTQFAYRTVLFGGITATARTCSAVDSFADGTAVPGVPSVAVVDWLTITPL